MSSPSKFSLSLFASRSERFYHPAGRIELAEQLGADRHYILQCNELYNVPH